MVGRTYFTRQATTILKFARSTANPELAAMLVEKVADLKSQFDAKSALALPSWALGKNPILNFYRSFVRVVRTAGRG